MGLYRFHREYRAHRQWIGGAHVVQHPARRENAKWKNSSPIGPGTSGILRLIGKRDARGRQEDAILYFFFFSFLFFALYLRSVLVDNLIISSSEFLGSLRSDFATRGKPLTGVHWKKFTIRRNIRSCSLHGDDAQDRLSPIFIRATSPCSPRQRLTKRISRRRLLRNLFRTTGKRSKSASGGISSISGTRGRRGVREPRRTLRFH